MIAMNRGLDLTKEFELLSTGGETIQVITAGMEALVDAYPAIGWCLDVSKSPWRPLDIPAGKMLVETIADPATIKKIKNDPRLELVYPPETIITDIDPVEVMLKIQKGEVSPGDIFICYQSIQFTIHQLDQDKVTFELNTDEKTRVYTFPIARAK